MPVAPFHSLWVVLFAARAIAHGVLPAPVCGCSPSVGGSCSISTRQFIAALTHSRVDEMCDVTHSRGDDSRPQTARGDAEGRAAKDRVALECRVRGRVRQVAESYGVCTEMADKAACERHPHKCQWGAQGAEECGLDEEKLLVEIAGSGHKDHPMVMAIMLQDECSERGERSCTQDGKCQIVRQGLSAFCEMSPKLLFRSLAHHPSLLPMMYTSHHGAVCRAGYEHGTPPVCKNWCHLERGICTLDVAVWPQVLLAVCGSIKERESCLAPACRWSRDEGCTTDPNHMVVHELTRQDQFLSQVFMVMQSATIPYQLRCEMGRRGRESCLTLPTSCDADYKHPTDSNLSLHSAVGAPPGMSGFLGQLAASIGKNHTMAAEVAHYMQDNPAEVNKVAQGVASAFSSWLHPALPPTPPPSELPVNALPYPHSAPPVAPPSSMPPQTWRPRRPLTSPSMPEPLPPRPWRQPAPDGFPIPMPSVSTTMSVHALGQAVVGSIYGPDGNVDINPWAVAAGALLCAGVCLGVAMGALCYAKLAHRGARDLAPPLLGGDHVQGDREMYRVEGLRDRDEDAIGTEPHYARPSM